MATWLLRAMRTRERALRLSTVGDVQMLRMNLVMGPSEPKDPQSLHQTRGATCCFIGPKSVSG